MAWTPWRTSGGARRLLLAVLGILSVPFFSLLVHRSVNPRILSYSAEYAAILGGYAVLLLMILLGVVYPATVGRHLLRGLAALAVILLGLELGSRLDILGPFSALTAFRRYQAFDGNLGYRLLPDRSFSAEIPGEPSVPLRTLRFGSEDIGFRSQAPSGRAEVAAVGDGATFASGVETEETWVALVGRSLDAEAFNFGMPATGPRQYFQVLERYGLRLHPHLVLFGFYTGSDFSDDWLFEKWREAGTSLSTVEFALFGQSRLTAFLGKHSAAFANGAILYNRLVNIGRSVSVATKDGPLILRPTRLVLAGEAMREGWGLAQTSLRDARRLVADAGARFVVVILPTKEEVYLSVMPGLEAFRQEDLDWQTAHQALVTFLQREGFTFCDLLPHLQALARGGLRLYFEKGVYLNRTGNREVAALAASCLRASGVVR